MVGIEQRHVPSHLADDDDQGLGPRDVHVWFAWVRADERRLRDAWSVLDPCERARSDRLRRPADRVRYISTRAHVRRLLAGYSQVGPDELTFTTTRDGKPELGGENAPRALRFNVSHSGAVAAIAVSRRSVGVDVERIQSDLDWRRIADEFFSPAEVGALGHVASTERRRAFFDCWVRKEAYLKALGVGLRRPTTTFAVPVLEPSGAVDDLDRQAPPGRRSTPTWSVCGLDAGRDYAAAVCSQRDANITTRWIRQT
jgi:4'-phosphopantetheinyl transferase